MSTSKNRRELKHKALALLALGLMTSVSAANADDVYLYGDSSNTGDITGQEVSNITEDTLSGKLYGIYSVSGDVTYNTVTLNVTNSSGNTYGAVTSDGSASNNTLYITGGSYASVRGGQVSSGEGDASSNTIEITDGTFSGNLIGGIVFGEGSADYNTVTINGGSFSSVRGGENDGTGDASYNTINITDGYISGYVMGGSNWGTGDANYNSVSVSAGTFDSRIIGGFSNNGDASNNSITISGGSFSEVRGGEADGTGDASNNTIEITDGTFSGTLTGGIVFGTGSADYNTVTINGGTYSSDIYGGYNEGTGDASYNTVTISGDDISTEAIIGGYVNGTSEGSAEYNTVIIDGVTTTSNIMGGYIYEDTVTESDGANYNTVVFYSGECGVENLTLSDGTVTSILSIGAGVVYNYAEGFSASTDYNTVTIYDGTFNYNVWGGNNKSLGEAVGNTVTIYGGTFSGTGTGVVAGNSDQLGYVSENTLVIYGGTFSSDVYAGRSALVPYFAINNGLTDDTDDEDEAYNNTVEIHGGTFSKNVYGGYSDYGTAVSNSVTIDDSTVTVSDDNESVDGNTYGGGSASISGNVYGGYSESNSVSYNSVSISSATVGENVYGGYSSSSYATGNSVTLAGSAEITGTVYGGYSGGSGDVSGNSLTVSGADNSAATVVNFDTITFDLSDVEDGDTMLTLSSETELDNVSIAVGDTTSLDLQSTVTLVAGDNVTLNNVSVESSSGEFSATYEYNNSAYLSGTFGYELYYTETAEGDEETVESGETYTSIQSLIITTGDTLTVTEADFGTALTWGTAQIDLGSGKYVFTNTSASLSDFEIDTDSFLNVSEASELINAENADGTTDLDVLTGLANSYSYSLSDGAISITGTGSTVSSSTGLDYQISSISTMDFYITADTSTSEAMLTVESADLSGTAVTAYADGGSYITEGYSVTLLEAGELITDNETTYTGKAVEGASLEYDLTVEKVDDTIIAYVEDTTASMRKETKSITETRAGQAAMVNQGSDLISGIMDAGTSLTLRPSGWAPFAAFSAGTYKYDTGSHVDIDGFNFAVGLMREFAGTNGTFTLGAAFQYGRGEYDSYAEGVNADGDSEYTGAALFAKHKWKSGFYAEAGLSAGYSQTDYFSSELLTGMDVRYDVGSKYWGVQIGLGKEIALSSGDKLDVYGKYLYNELDSSSATLSSGETYDFDEVDSSRLRIGLRYTRALSETGSCYVGAAYQYQFDGDASAAYRGYSTLTPSLEGSSGMIELGVQFSPKKSPVSLGLGMTGWVGTQQGVEGALKFKWDL